MLSRVRSTMVRRGLRFPRKGRIRLALLVLLLIAGVALIRSSGVGASIYNPSLIKDAVPGFLKNQPNAQHAKNLKPPLNFDAVSEIIQQNQLYNNIPVDTLEWHNKRVVVKCSFDTALVKLANTLMMRYHPKYGAVVAMDAKTGRILSLVSYQNGEGPPMGEAIFTKSFFPAASVFKTITAAAAIEQSALLPESRLAITGNRHTLYKFQIERSLRNATDISFEDAFAYSANPIFARLGMYSIGRERLMAYADKFGFNSAIPCELANEPSLAVVPDSAFAIAEFSSGYTQQTTISPLYGAMLAAAMTNRGEMVLPTLVDTIVSIDDNRTLYARSTQLWRAPIRPATAAVLADIMGKVTVYGTARKSFRQLRQSSRYDDYRFGGKTGSLDKDGFGRVDWFVGFASHRYNRTSPIAVGIVTVHGDYWTVHSSYIAAEMFRTYINNLDRRAKKTVVPSTVIAKSN